MATLIYPPMSKGYVEVFIKDMNSVMWKSPRHAGTTWSGTTMKKHVLCKEVRAGLIARSDILSPGVYLSRCKDHVVFRIHRIAGSRLRKVVRNFVPEKAYMRRYPL
ncbi:hypothetical protein TNCV_3290041 [Trichonephila clavipes]|nr:hypothetical protein TNCV_3290041 [Trichonephila clavipes]